MVNSCRETQYLIVNADAPHFAILQCGFRRELITNFVSEQIIHSYWFSICDTYLLNLFFSINAIIQVDVAGCKPETMF